MPSACRYCYNLRSTELFNVSLRGREEVPMPLSPLNPSIDSPIPRFPDYPIQGSPCLW
jgi:hypothetical protein